MNSVSCHTYFDGTGFIVKWFLGAKLLFNDFFNDVWSVDGDVKRQVYTRLKEVSGVEELPFLMRDYQQEPMVLFCDFDQIDSVLTKTLEILRTTTSSSIARNQYGDCLERYNNRPGDNNLLKFLQAKIQARRAEELEESIDKMCLIANKHPHIVKKLKRTRLDKAEILSAVERFAQTQKESETEPLQQRASYVRDVLGMPDGECPL